MSGIDDLNKETYRRRIGTGGAREQMEVWTHGKKRFTVRATEPAIEGEAIAATPDAPTRLGNGVFFFRNDGDGKSQLCVLYPSGAVQILATEP